MSAELYKRSLFLISFIALFLSACAQDSIAVPAVPKTGKQLSDFIPRGWDTLRVVTADLNKDKLSDKVAVLGSKADTANGDLPRLLIVLFGAKKGYTLSSSSSSAIMCRDCGGVFGDPFSDLKVDTSTIEIQHYGGSSWRWGYLHVFKYRGNDWYLVNSSSGGYHNVEYCDSLEDFVGSDREIDYVTGLAKESSVSEDCIATEKEYKVELKPLIRLSEFDIFKEE